MPGKTPENLSSETLWDVISFNSEGLIPAIAQQYDTGEVLMMAWMNRESIEESLRTGQVCYWSRSRKKLWRKGEESGQVQRLESLRIDCDGDTLLLLVNQKGVACHTGRRSCFYRTSHDDATLTTNQEVQISPDTLYKE
jgi:phosphoribosyl-AMP cyclohydrolase